MKTVTVADYGLGNIASVLAALRVIGFECVVDTDGDDIAKSDVVVVPGVAAFSAGLERLRRRGQAQALDGHWRAGKPLIGLCLGAQMFLDRSAESPQTTGLSYASGEVVALDPAKCRVPVQGWLRVEDSNHGRVQTLGVDVDGLFYFSHSFRMVVESNASLMGVTWANLERIVAVYKEANVIGVQFHPERSGPRGLAFLHGLLTTSILTA